MPDFALWRRLDTPGHDAALLTPASFGWSLQGTAVFRHNGGPACLKYAVELNADWSTRRGHVDGFMSDRKIAALIERQAGGWTLNGAYVPGLEHLVDLDFAFTPATNLQQLRRVAIRVGEAVEFPVAWLNEDATALTELPQRYERRLETTYWYEAPTVPYEAALELSPNGFVATYPSLWQAEPPD